MIHKISQLNILVSYDKICLHTNDMFSVYKEYILAAIINRRRFDLAGNTVKYVGHTPVGVSAALNLNKANFIFLGHFPVYLLSTAFNKKIAINEIRIDFSLEHLFIMFAILNSIYVWTKCNSALINEQFKN